MSADAVGSLAEEAAKLIAAMQGWAQDHADATDSQPGAAPDTNEEPGRATDTEGDAHPRGSGQHGAECRYCPLCQLARIAKTTSPEVRDHLASAALSIALAVKGLLDNVNADSQAERKAPVEKIDLTED